MGIPVFQDGGVLTAEQLNAAFQAVIDSVQNGGTLQDMLLVNPTVNGGTLNSPAIDTPTTSGGTISGATLSGCTTSGGTASGTALENCTLSNPDFSTGITQALGVQNVGPFVQPADLSANAVITGLSPSVPSPASLSGLVAAGNAFVNGYRTVATSSLGFTCSGSSDNYLALSTSGTLSVQSVANGATAPTAPANAIQIAKVVTDPIVSPEPTLAASTAAGTLASGTYEYQLVAHDATGYGLPSALVSITTSATGEVVLTWTNPNNATSMDIYGRVSGSIGLLASGVTGTTWTDTGAATVGAAPPTSATSNAIQSWEWTCEVGTRPYDLAVTLYGTLTASSTPFQVMLNRNITLNNKLATAYAAKAPGSAVTLNIVTITGASASSAGTTTTIGTVTFASGSYVGTVSLTQGMSVTAGSVLAVQVPSTIDGTISNISFVIGALIV